MFNKKTRSLFMIPYVMWMLLFVVFPILLIVYYSFRDINGNFTLSNYQVFFSSTYVLMTLYSFWYAFLITLICLVISYPLAFIISKSKYSELLLLLIILPTWINILLKTYAFLGLFGEYGTINSFLEYIGIGTQSLLFNSFSFVFVSSYIFLPFMLLPIYNSVVGINRNLIEASYDSKRASNSSSVSPGTMICIASGSKFSPTAEPGFASLVECTIHSLY